MFGPAVITAAKIDRVDESHFSVPVNLGGRQFELHGWLPNDGPIRFRSTVGGIHTPPVGERTLYVNYVPSNVAESELRFRLDP